MAECLPLKRLIKAMKENPSITAQLAQAQADLAKQQTNFFKALFDGVNVVFELTPDAEKMVKDAGVSNIQISLPGILLWPSSGDELSIESNGVEIVFTVLSRRLRLANGKPPTIVFYVDKPRGANNGRFCFFRPQDDNTPS